MHIDTRNTKTRLLWLDSFKIDCNPEIFDRNSEIVLLKFDIHPAKLYGTHPQIETNKKKIHIYTIIL